MAIALRYAARSHVGLVRANNQDSAYAGPHLLVVCDGMGGHAGGDVASSLAIGELAPLDGESHGPDAGAHLTAAITQAHHMLLDRVDEEPALAGMGTTVTALLRSGSKFALAHLGDSRAYLLRAGAIVQLTKDHTFVQTLVDEGRLTPFEAEHHPQRSVLMRVLSDVVDDVEPDLSMREAKIGDRYLLCSDGLSGVVSLETLHDTLADQEDPEATCDTLVQLALRAGAPDNVTCIVADVVDDPAQGGTAPFVVGAASLHQPRTPDGASPAERAAALTAGRDRDDGDDASDSKPPTLRDRRRVVGGALLAVLLLVSGGLGAWRWVTEQFFVGDSAGSVAIFNGLPQDLGPIGMSRLRATTDVPLVDLPDYARAKLDDGVPAKDESDAQRIVGTYRDLATRCRALISPTPGASPTGATPSESTQATTPSTTTGPTPTRTATPTSSARPGPTSSGSAAPTPTYGPSLEPAPTDTPSASPSPELDCGNLAPGGG